ncbi:uncharacterized protein LOC143322906 [Chaetodon auriga]|uniref:uncharacterized protein LOC143322906 n=1 Tax=Chaetodon auriga TaxID=39042 RepID=UPI004032C6C5
MTATNIQWRWRGDGCRGIRSVFLLTATIVLLLLLQQGTSQPNQQQGCENSNSSCRASNCRRRRELLPEITRSPLKPEENSWYTVVLSTARRITNDSCYVCTQLPHGVGDAIPVTPRPLNISETLGVMLAFTLGVSLRNRTVTDMTKSINMCNISITNYGGSTARFWNMTQVTQVGVHQSIMTTNPTKQQGTVCFTRKCFTEREHFLGISPCKQTVMATCGVSWGNGNTTSCRNRTPYIASLNLTDTVSLNRPGYDNPVLLLPNGDGYRSLKEHVWVCGQHVYQSLHPGWCGTCYLAKLVSSVTILPTLSHFHTHYTHYYIPHRARRDTERVPQWQKGIGGFLPWWGTVNNAFKIDDLAVELENLTALVSSGFSALTPTVQGIRNVALQNRMAMDMMFASQGGVCHIIGTDCCTYIPDITDNMTHVVSHLNDLLHEEKTKDSEKWSLWSWLTDGGWKVTLLKILTPFLLFLTVFMIVICCGIPCIKALITSQVKSSVGQFMIQSEDDPSLDWVPPYANLDDF